MDNLILDEEAKEGEKEREAAENRKREREGHFKEKNWKLKRRN